MNYIKIYFNKENIDDLLIDDIVDFFKVEKKESDKIEYKSYDVRGSKKKDIPDSIFESICAFLNTEGGLLIWGAPKGETGENKKDKIFKGDLSPVAELYEQDAFINKVSDLITPTPNRIQFRQLDYQGKYVYIMHIQKSPYSPHQYRGKYYMRLDGQSRVAPHAYIEALFRKVTFPNISAYIKFPLKIQVPNSREAWISIELMLSFWNKSQFQNDFDLYYRLITEEGCIDHKSWDFNLDKDLEYQNHFSILNRYNAKGVIYYGEPVQEYRKILLNNNDVGEFNFNMILAFGTRLSPCKWEITMSIF